MNKINKKIVKIAKILIAELQEEANYSNNAMAYIDECFNQNYVIGKKSGIKYNVRYNGRYFKLVALEGRNDIPEDEYVDEDEIIDMYNDAVVDLIKNYHYVDGYDEIRDLCFESEANHYDVNNKEYIITDKDGNAVDTTDEFNDDLNESTKELCFRLIDENALVDYDVYAAFIGANGKDSGVTQEFDYSKFKTSNDIQMETT